MKSYAPNILRIGIALIVMWFGFQQLFHPEIWTSYLPDFVKLFPFTSTTFVYLNGWFEVFASLLLILGVFTRVVSFLMALHLLGIVFSLGYDSTAMRDLGLSVALFSVFMYGSDSWSFDKKINGMNLNNEI